MKCRGIFSNCIVCFCAFTVRLPMRSREIPSSFFGSEKGMANSLILVLSFRKAQSFPNCFPHLMLHVRSGILHQPWPLGGTVSAILLGGKLGEAAAAEGCLATWRAEICPLVHCWVREAGQVVHPSQPCCLFGTMCGCSSCHWRVQWWWRVRAMRAGHVSPVWPSAMPASSLSHLGKEPGGCPPIYLARHSKRWTSKWVGRQVDPFLHPQPYQRKWGYCFHVCRLLALSLLSPQRNVSLSCCISLEIGSSKHFWYYSLLQRRRAPISLAEAINLYSLSAPWVGTCWGLVLYSFLCQVPCTLLALHYCYYY